MKSTQSNQGIGEAIGRRYRLNELTSYGQLK
jgi:hypothetical protein